jgi:hypothetical protein
MPLVVTALYDLAQRESEPRRRSAAEYLELSRFLFASPVDLHVFCEPNLVAPLGEMMRFRPEGCATQIQALAFEDLPEWRSGQRAVQGLADGSLVRTASTLNHVKDSPAAQTVWWSKFALMKRAADAHRGGHEESVWWVDCGIIHGCLLPESQQLELGNITRPVFGQVSNLDHIKDDTADYLRRGVTCIAGGILGVPDSQIEELAATFSERLQTTLDQGLLVNEEALYSCLALEIECDLIETTFHRLLVDVAGFGQMSPVVVKMEVTNLVELSSIDDCVDVESLIARRVHLPSPGRSDRVSLNPSIARDPQGGYLCIVRNTNYRYIDGDYRRLDGGDVIRTENVLVKLNDDFAPEWSSVIDDQLARTEPPLFPVVGFEDARLVLRAGQWWMSATSREHRRDGRCQIVLSKLVIASDNAVAITESHELPFLTAYGHEKNWMPILGRDHAWVWGTEPTVVCRFDDVTNSLVPSRTAKGNHGLRGGSQVVWWANGWLAVIHDVVHSNAQRTYRHRFARWDADWNLVQVTDPFRLGNDPYGLEFCAGLVASRDSERLILSVGIGDERAEVIEMTVPDWLVRIPGPTTSQSDLQH